MRYVSSGFIEASLSPSGYATANIDINGTLIDASYITEIIINEDIGDSGSFSIGTFNTTVADITILTEALPSTITGVPIEIRYGYFVDGHFEYLIMGTFYAESNDISRTGLFTTIHAHDKSIEFTDQYVSELDWSVTHTVQEVIEEVASDLSINYHINGQMQYITVYEKPEGTYRDVIMQMSALTGLNAKIDSYGYLVFIRIENRTAVESYGAYNYETRNFQLTTNEPTRYGKVFVNYKYTDTSGEEHTTTFEYTAGTGENAITLDTVNIRTQAAATNFGTRILGSTGLEYYGYTVTLPGQPQIELGDTISIEDVFGNVKDFLVLKSTQTFDGILKSTFSAIVNDLESKINGDNITGSVSDQASTAIDAAQAAINKAEYASTKADEAAVSAQNAASSASSAATSASNAQASAQASASSAQASANSANASAQSASNSEASAQASAQSAQNAQKSADAALISLANVEDVVGVLEWITAHGTMTANGSTPLDPSKVYFIVDPNGDYVVGNTHYSIVSEPKSEDRTSYYTLSVDESVQNYIATHVVVDGEGLWLIPDSGGNKVLIATGAGSSYPVAGTYIIGKVNGVDTVFARFTQSGATMSAENGTQIANLGYGIGTAETGTAQAPYYSIGERSIGQGSIGVGNYSSSSTYEEGDLCIYANALYRCVTAITTPEAWNSSHWEIAIGNYSVSEGLWTIASGYASHAEGRSTKATGYASHAEGGNMGAPINGPFAKGTCSHAEGASTLASGLTSHAEGSESQANGRYSHAQNISTIANGEAQTTLGKYNVADSSNAVIIGNGTDYNARSNALTVDWNGIVQASGAIAYGVCDTAGATADKTVTVSHSGFKLVTGSQVLIKFTNANAVANPTLNVNSTGAKAIRRYGTATPSTSAGASWNAGSVILLIYDGTDWQMVGWLNTTYSSMTDAEYQAGTSTSARLITPARLKGAIEYWAVPKTGGTMTGQLKTSFNSSVAMGSYGASATTVPNLVEELRFSSGCMGSANIGTAYSASGYTIATGWYNFIYTPHRSGGVNGQASGDNCNYGNLFLLGMNNTNGQFIVRVANGAIAQVIKLVEENTLSNYVQGSALGDYIVSEGSTNGWYWRKYKSKKCELWKNVSQTVSAYAESSFILGSSSVTNYPFTITSPIVQAYCRKMGTGGGYISYDYDRTDYWSGVAYSRATVATGTSLSINYSLYVRAIYS